MDVSPLSSPILLAVSQDLPCSVGPHHQDVYGRKHYWLDDKTLTSTPQSVRKDVRFILPADSPCDDIDATFVSKLPTLFSTPSSIMKKRGRRSISYSEFPSPRLATSRHHLATRTSPFQEHLNRPRRRATVIRTDLFKDPALPLTIVEPPRKRTSDPRVSCAHCTYPSHLSEPRLRRRGRRSDLRGAFRNATDVCQSAVHVSATVDGPGLHEQTIEHQITLSLLHEMERATGGQTTLPQTNKQAKSRPFAKGILSTLGNFIRSLGSHTTTGVVRI